MVIAKIEGGLGNQMFIWAAAYALSKHCSTQCIADISHYKHYKQNNGVTARNFALSDFPEWNAKSHTTGKYRRLFEGNNIISRLRRKGQRLNYYFEKEYRYNEDFWKTQGSVYLDGFFQDERYFKAYRSELVEIFSFDGLTLNEENKGLIEEIVNSNSASIHVRRGDYASNKSINELHGTLSIEYYRKAIDYLRNQVENVKFFIFSDDPEWVKANLGLDGAVISDINSNMSPIYDMMLMSKCKHNVVANSSYSWWAAWLNDNIAKIVIAPQKWYAREEKNIRSKGIIPESWIEM